MCSSVSGRGHRVSGVVVARPVWRCTFTLVAICFIIRLMPANAAPEGTLTMGLHVSLAPTWFDPAEAPGDLAV